MLVHGKNITQAAVQGTLLIDGGSASRFEYELYDIHTCTNDVVVGRHEAGDLWRAGLQTVGQRSPEISHHFEEVAARRGKHRIGAPNRLLNEYLITHQLGGLQSLPNRIAPRGLRLRHFNQ